MESHVDCFIKALGTILIVIALLEIYQYFKDSYDTQRLHK